MFKTWRCQTFIYLSLAVLVIFGATGCSSWLDEAAGVVAPEPEQALDETLRPSPDLPPQDVVRIQVEALKNNDSENTGIELTFRFASPANKQATGPLNRFIRLVKEPAYRPMLNHKEAEYSPIRISGDTAEQRVTIIGQDGQATVYLFELSKQNLSSCVDCWMTDSVTIVPTKQQDLTDI